MTRIVLVLCLLATPASAEINMADAIEWQTIDADVVVRGFVTSVNHVRTKNLEWQDLTFQIDAPWDTPAQKALYGGSSEQGLFAIVHFKSDANIERVKKLLVDPNGHVRAAADDALDRWHVPHTEPK